MYRSLALRILVLNLFSGLLQNLLWGVCVMEKMALGGAMLIVSHMQKA